ncbi:MAG TPA: hypothetical protein VHD33_00695, partial [Legionellaceae bacterium]|nr:hypothetical protein [Legionellaceae bacterium]
MQLINNSWANIGLYIILPIILFVIALLFLTIDYIRDKKIEFTFNSKGGATNWTSLAISFIAMLLFLKGLHQYFLDKPLIEKPNTIINRQEPKRDSTKKRVSIKKRSI